jgi:hypothetical protein
MDGIHHTAIGTILTMVGDILAIMDIIIIQCMDGVIQATDTLTAIPTEEITLTTLAEEDLIILTA